MRCSMKPPARDRCRVRIALRPDSAKSGHASLRPNHSVHPHEVLAMSSAADLNLAEIPYESGVLRFRYTRFMAPDGTRWI